MPATERCPGQSSGWQEVLSLAARSSLSVMDATILTMLHGKIHAPLNASKRKWFSKLGRDAPHIAQEPAIGREASPGPVSAGWPAISREHGQLSRRLLRTLQNCPASLANPNQSDLRLIGLRCPTAIQPEVRAIGFEPSATLRG
jgi:hypothetical protein